MHDGRTLIRWILALLAGLAIAIFCVALLRYGERSVRSTLEKNGRTDALAAANSVAHAIQIYTEERAAEAAYLSDLCEDGTIRSQKDFLEFTHTMARSHGEYRGFLWRAANTPDSWTRPEGRDPAISAAMPAIESALQAARGSAAGLERTRVLVGVEPRTGRSIIGILRSTTGGAPMRSGLLYVELGTENLEQILTIPFFHDRFGYRVEVDGVPLWQTGGVMPEDPPAGTHEVLRTALAGGQMGIHVWFLPQVRPDPARTLKGVRMTGFMVSLLAGVCTAATLVRCGQRRGTAE